jgi:hypothetical protein
VRHPELGRVVPKNVLPTDKPQKYASVLHSVPRAAPLKRVLHREWVCDEHYRVLSPSLVSVDCAFHRWRLSPLSLSRPVGGPYLLSSAQQRLRAANTSHVADCPSHMHAHVIAGRCPPHAFRASL